MSFPDFNYVIPAPANTFLLKAWAHKVGGKIRVSYSQHLVHGLGVSPQHQWLVPITANSSDLPGGAFTLLLHDGSVNAAAGVADNSEFKDVAEWLKAVEMAISDMWFVDGLKMCARLSKEYDEYLISEGFEVSAK
ncbi:MAG: hypothetical protein Q8S55_09090 [Methylococcaceae bacterium]|nr:hypothetical protein [Methylococcaceae bacterium]